MINTLRKAFAGKRVFVTGHTGFKGPWLLALLDTLGAEMTGYALAPETKPSIYELIGGDKLCRSVIADLRDRDTLTQVVRDFRPDVVLHLGAQSLVRRSYREPVATFESNVTGTINLLEAIRALPGRCDTVVVTTDKVYAERADSKPFIESDKLGGFDPYSMSKAACEIVCEGYRSSFFHPSKLAVHGKTLATARAGNVIGGGDWCEDRLLPDLARAMAAGTPVRIRNPYSTRPWQHVLEPLTGYLQLAAALAADPARHATAYNFGPSDTDALAVGRVIELALNAWGGGSSFVHADPNAPHEAALLRINSDKAHQALGWRPRWSAETAITKTIDWYKHAPPHALTYTRSQIADYFAATPL